MINEVVVWNHCMKPGGFLQTLWKATGETGKRNTEFYSGKHQGGGTLNLESGLGEVETK